MLSVPVRSVLISDKVDPACPALLQEHGILYTLKPGLNKEQLIEELKNHDGLIVRSETKVTEEIFEKCPSLKVVGRAGTGIDNIDLTAATKRGVLVINTPGGNSISACELTCALITNLARHVSRASEGMKAGRWERGSCMGRELQGKTLAVLGLGRVGREVALRMASWGLNIIGYDPVASPDSLPSFISLLPLDEIWPKADIITVHTPLCPATRGLVNEEVLLKKCRRGVWVVNAARGGVVDEPGLLSALKAGQVGAAALDVFSMEPPFQDPILAQLVAHPAVLATPHLGASTSEAQVRVAIEIAEQFIALAQPSSGYRLEGVVNLPGAREVSEGGGWAELGRRLGGLVRPRGQAALIASGGAPCLPAPVLLGALKPYSTNGLNLVSAAAAAAKAGLNLATSLQKGSTSQLHLKDLVTGLTVTGTVNGAGEPIVTRINDAEFIPGVVLADQCLALPMKDPVKDLNLLIGELLKSGQMMSRMAIANGKSCSWLIGQLQNAAPIDLSHISNLVLF